MHKRLGTPLADRDPGIAINRVGFPALAFPSGLFGRSHELALLTQAATQPPTAAAVFVTGPPGIGKSALLAALRADIGRRAGWCAYGAFADQALAGPYTALAHALDDLARQLLAEPAPRLRQIQQQLRQAVGSNGALLLSLAPGFERLIGTHPAMLTIAAEQPARLLATLRLVFDALAKWGRPLALCIDDLQRADMNSLEILRRLLLEGPRPPVLVVISLTTGIPVDTAVLLTAAEIQRQRPDIALLTPAALDEATVAEIVRATVGHDTRVDAEGSAAALHRITQGNPQILRQALYAAKAESTWRPSPLNGRWVWNPLVTAQLDASDHLRAMMAVRLRELPPETLQVLQEAACLGPEVDLALLRAAMTPEGGEFSDVPGEAENAAGAAALAHGQAAGLVIDTGMEEESGQEHGVRYRFAHDEVRSALLATLDAEKRRAIHRRVGDYLLSSTAPDDRGSTIFAIVRHLAAALDPVQDGERRAEMAELLLEAGQRALAMGAAGTATTYAQGALRWAQALDDGWQTHYRLHLQVYELAAHTAIYTGDAARLEAYIKAVLQKAQAPSDKAGVYKAGINAATLQGDYARALDLLQEGLAELGVRVPRRPTSLQVVAGYAHARLALRRQAIAALCTLPTTSERTWWEAGELVTTAYMALQWSGEHNLLAYLALLGVRWSMQHGHTPLSAMAYAIYSVLLSSRFGDTGGGQRYAQLAADLNERPENRHQRAGVLLILHAMVLHWSEPIGEAVAGLRRARQYALEEGDVRLATDCTIASINYAQMMGTPLAVLARELAALLDELAVYGETVPLAMGRLLLQNIRALEGAPGGVAGEAASGVETWPAQGDASVVDEDAIRLRLEQGGNRFGLYALYGLRATRHLLFGQAAEAVQAADQARMQATTVGTSLFAEAMRCQVDALARLAWYGHAPAEERPWLLRAVRQDVKQLQRWAARSPANHRHRLHQVQAELARVQGQSDTAEEHYAAAWSLAVTHGFVHDEGGAAELAARHFMREAQFAKAAEWRRRACDAYLRWGSTAKLRYLDQTLPVLAGGAAACAPPGSGTGSRVQVTTDIADIARELRALGAYADPQLAVRHLLAAVSRQLGASRAAFLLCQEDRIILYAELRAGEAEASFPAAVLDDDMPAPGVPLSVIRLARQQGMALCTDAPEPGAHSSHLAGRVQQQPPLALLCAPLVVHGHTVALLLVERRYAHTHHSDAGAKAGGFAAHDVLYVEILGTQAALLVETSYLRRRLVAAGPALSDLDGASAASGAELSAWLLGGLRVRHRGREITPYLQGRLGDLMALLLLQPSDKALARGEIAALFWPDTLDGQALTNVRNLLHKLRTVWPEVGDVLEITRQQVQWKVRPGAGIWTDVDAFERGVAEAGRLSGAAAIHLLRTSLELYTGDLLPAASDAWALAWQERLRARRLAALGRLVDLLIERHDFAAALHYSQLMVAAAPCDEEPYRQLMRAHALAGDVVAARQAYATCVAMLAREHDAPPSPATEAVYRQFAALA